MRKRVQIREASHLGGGKKDSVKEASVERRA